MGAIYFMDQILNNKNFIEIRQVKFNLEFKAKIGKAFGQARADKSERIAKKVLGFQFSYISNGKKISGFLVIPKKLSAEKPPCIIYNRGGYQDFGILRHGIIFNAMGELASQGYAVIASQYSGNSLSEGKDEYGGSDVEDIINLHKILKSLSFVDLKRIGMLGGSRGVMMSLLVMKQVKWVKAACLRSGLYDLFDTAKHRPEMERVYKEAFGGSKVEKEKRSVVFWANKLSLKVPILMLHGSADWRADPKEALKASKTFLEHSIPHRLVIFEGAGHSLSEFAEEADQMAFNWFEKYLKNNSPLPNLKPHGE